MPQSKYLGLQIAIQRPGSREISTEAGLANSWQEKESCHRRTEKQWCGRRWLLSTQGKPTSRVAVGKDLHTVTNPALRGA